MSKSTKLEYENRIFTIQGWIIDGVPDYLIEKQIEQKWGLKKCQKGRYIKEAYTRWAKDKEIDISERRDARIAELQQMIRDMSPEFKKTPKGISVMLNVKKEISKLEALYPIRKLQIAGDNDNPIKVQHSTLSEQQEKDFEEFLIQKYNFKKKK